MYHIHLPLQLYNHNSLPGPHSVVCHRCRRRRLACINNLGIRISRSSRVSLAVCNDDDDASFEHFIISDPSCAEHKRKQQQQQHKHDDDDDDDRIPDAVRRPFAPERAENRLHSASAAPREMLMFYRFCLFC